MDQNPMGIQFLASNIIRVYSLNHPRDVSRFLHGMRRAIRQGYQEVTADFSEVDGVFPNACVPIAAIIQHYRTNNIDVKLVGQPGYLGVIRFGDPLLATAENLENEVDPLSRIWCFTDEKMVSRLVTRLVKSIMERVECSPGVVEAFEWCLNEVMDNVLQHSQATAGYTMVQVHTEARRLVICVADTGLGIYGTLAKSAHKPRNPIDAITLAVKEGVTRDKKIGQGNGLWGLLEIVKKNSGQLSITSGEGSLFVRNLDVQTFDRLPFIDYEHRGTIVDFQIDASQGIDIADALNGHRPVNLMLENLENDQGECLLVVRDHAHGTGTRRAGEQLRNLVINFIHEGAGRVVLDFSGIAVISSSFADELIGKLVVRYGFVGFQSAIRLKGMNEAVQVIVHRSVAQRMMEAIEMPPNP